MKSWLSKGSVVNRWHRGGRATLLLFVLVGCSGNARDVLGTWQGFVDPEAESGRVEVDIHTVLLDAFEGEMSVRDQGLVGVRIRGRMHGDELTGELIGFGVDVAGRLRGDELEVHVDDPRLPTNVDVTLIRDHPTFARFEVPRLDGEGERVVEYEYQPPAPLDDGWETGDLSEYGLDRQALGELVVSILDGDFPRLDSLLIAKDGRLLVEEYFYGNRADDLHTVHSVTKSVTSLLIGRALDTGAIHDTGDFIYDLLPPDREGRWITERYPITLRDTLRMAAGIDWLENIPYTNLRNSALAMALTDDPLRYVLDRRLTVPPGTRFEYNSGLSHVLGVVLLQATGVYVDEYAEQYLFSPLGIDDFSWARDVRRDTATGGGLALRERDMLKLGQLVLQRGRWDGRQIVSEPWIAASTATQIQTGITEYGYQWWLGHVEAEEGPLTIVSARGYGGQTIAIVPELETVVVSTAQNYEGIRPTAALSIEEHLARVLGVSF